MMHPYVVYGEPPRPAPPEILSPGENCFETVPLFPLADAPGISWPLSGETAQAAGTEPDTAPPVSETAEASGAVRQAESRGIRRFISAETGGLLVLGDAEIEIPPEALAADTEIRISRLSQPADTGGGLTNVTAGGGGYRFEPAGLIFNRAVTIRMGYDSRLRENEPALEHI
jgi:hypothetical protein